MSVEDSMSVQTHGSAEKDVQKDERTTGSRVLERKDRLVSFCPRLKTYGPVVKEEIKVKCSGPRHTFCPVRLGQKVGDPASTANFVPRKGTVVNLEVKSLLLSPLRTCLSSRVKDKQFPYLPNS